MCPPGTQQRSNPGAAQPCIPCPAGQVSTGLGTPCTACAQGQFANFQQTACLPACPNTNIAAVQGQCQPCPAGSG